MHDAPNFPPSGKGGRFTDYPGRGLRTGPCWRAMFSAITDAPGPILGDHLDRIGSAAGDCALWTAKLILTRARAAGILTVRKELVGSRHRNVYVRTDQPVKHTRERVSPEWVAEWARASGVGRLEREFADG